MRVKLVICAIVVVLAGWRCGPRGWAAEPVHRQPLGVGSVQFIRGPASVSFELKEHTLSREYAHRGEASETIRIVAERADPVSEPYVHFIYPTPRAPVTGDLKAGLWLRAKAAGTQLLGRVVLPHVRNPQRPDAARTVLIPGTRYSNAPNWQRLELADPVAALRKQIQILRLELGTEVDASDAYIDQLILNIYSPEGESQVWINEVEIGPVMGEIPRVSHAATQGLVPTRRVSSTVEVVRDQLSVDGRRFFFRGIRLTDTPVEVHRRAGFNTVFLEPTASIQTIDEVARQELFAVPILGLPDLDHGVVPVARSESHPLPRETVTKLQNTGRLLFWHLGDGRGQDQLERIAQLASWVREADPDRPVGVNADEGLWPYSRHVDLLGVHRWPLHTGLELISYRDWLRQRRLLARPGTLTWTWVQTHLPEWHTSLVYQKPPTADFDEPIGPQPEQIRLLTYLAIATGCRGIAFSSDRFLADSHQGRDRLLAVALLNLELQMLEPILLSLVKPPMWIDTSHPQVKAAVLHGDKGILVLPIWLGSGSQCVPSQATTASLRMVVPMIPPNYQPWEVSPVEVRSLIPKRVAGGTEIALADFSLTAAVVFTNDMTHDGPVVYWQQQVRRLAESASGWSVDMARVELDKVRAVSAQLASRTQPNAGHQVLWREAETRWRSAQALHQAGRFREAYQEAHRALRPLRLLMRWQWDQAVAEVGTVTGTPYLVSYFTLPRHWAMWASIKQSRPGENRLPLGGFEGAEGQGWSITQKLRDDVRGSYRYGIDRPFEGGKYLELAMAGREGKPAPDALEQSVMAATSEPVRLPPGTLVRIRASVRIPGPITASPDGAMLFDSAGGEPLAVHLTEPTDWRTLTIYRQVPPTGEIRITLALTGLGVVQWDDVRLEPIFETATP
jgi:hypothetical protein